MPLFWTAVWAVVIFGSIFWYAAMLFAVGFKAGREIVELAGRLGGQSAAGAGVSAAAASRTNEGTRDP